MSSDVYVDYIIENYKDIVRDNQGDYKEILEYVRDYGTEEDLEKMRTYMILIENDFDLLDV